MTDLHTSGAVTGTGDWSRPPAALPALCVTRITSWGIVYYAFPVLNPPVHRRNRLACRSHNGIVLGRAARLGPRRNPYRPDHRSSWSPPVVMTIGSILGALSLLGVAAAPSLPVFAIGWLLAGGAMAATFYQPAAAALTRWFAPHHIRALTVVTLAGGLASTVFAPARTSGGSPTSRGSAVTWSTLCPGCRST